jgi:hypothetical protein
VKLNINQNQKSKVMEIKKEKKDEILFRTEKLLYYNELVIKQCDTWLSAEEGNRNIERAIRERRKKERELNQGFRDNQDYHS